MEAAKKTYVALRPRWRNEKVAKNWIQQLERHAFKRLGNLNVDNIGREDVLAVLDADLDQQTGNGTPCAQEYQSHTLMVPGQWMSGYERSRRSY